METLNINFPWYLYYGGAAVYIWVAIGAMKKAALEE